jgi:Ca2+:H+ antiporter
MNWLLIFIPAAIGLHFFAPGEALWTFACAGLGILPLAGYMGRATEMLAERTGAGIGGLLNATFGNAAEFIIALAALKAGMHDVVKASLAGSIMGNVLLVLGVSMFAGGLRHREQRFSAAAARSHATMMSLAAIALILPAAYHYTAVGSGEPALESISTWFSVVLLAVYAAYLIFSLGTHRAIFQGRAQATSWGPPPKTWSVTRAALVLAGATALIAWLSEILVATLAPATAVLGLGPQFVGVFVVAVLGNAAEHSTAVTAALKNRMDLSMSIAIGSGVQVALLLAPALVLLSHVAGPHPMDLAFPGGLVLSVLIAIFVSGQVASDGRSNWLEGLLLLAVYAILGLLYFFVPGGGLA